MANNSLSAPSSSGASVPMASAGVASTAVGPVVVTSSPASVIGVGAVTKPALDGWLMNDDGAGWGRPGDAAQSDAGAGNGARGSSAAPALGVRLTSWIQSAKKRVSRAGDFPALRVNLWRKGSGGLVDDAFRSGGLNGLEVPPGLYVLTFRGSSAAVPGGYASNVPVELSLGNGRQARIEKIKTYADGDVVVLVRLLPAKTPGGN